MEVDFQQNNQQFNDDDDEFSLKNAMSIKKRSYRLEIRKKKLQQTFNKTRKLNFQDLSNLNEYSNNQLNSIQPNPQQFNNIQSIQQQSDMVENTYQQNNQQMQICQKELDFKAEYDRIFQLVNQLNSYIYNFDPANNAQLDNVLQQILNEYLINEKPPEVINILKQLFIHFSLHLLIKNTQVDLATKNTALWCLINLSHLPNDQHEVIRKLIDQDIVSTLKAILKDNKNSMLFENAIWLAVNISLEDPQYRYKFFEEGFLFFLSNCVQNIAKSINQGETEIADNLIRVILNLSTTMLSIHDKIDDEQFRIIASIMNLCLKMGKSEYFNQITHGLTYLFIEDNPLSEAQFNILYECRFFSQYFISCIQTDEDMVNVSSLYKLISLQDQKYIMLLVKQDLIYPLYIMMSHTLSTVRENIAFSLSNMFMNGESFIQIASQYMLDSKIISQIEEEETLDVQKEAIWALSTLLQHQSDEQKEEFLSNKEVIHILCDFLNKKYQQLPDQILMKLLDCFISILDFGEKLTKEDDSYEQNPFWICIDRYQSIRTLDHIAIEGSEENQQRASKIIEEYSWTKQYEQNILN
ncbi:hypothetical protein TTHERM_00591640 (macronuclear) [Tetrahymena thermophila SB210]|uniref:Importin subunit alpha n=1 Tax=Tetrahymena thermophila (strain SB210) TaxID=312017 RepID=I7M2C2_TETTS|nr:hypothetical protein TTHERM_00591640 [Tetrahymena thermophila SB210]EAR99728.3 hypothetical protein TTHERM_00591640 [Tetrahymena thermophila SB210]|eukprot:XP_001019973.3 hypothetical protein TTHERM_00591640 [Tetrahymena thermophila SB210]